MESRHGRLHQGHAYSAVTVSLLKYSNFASPNCFQQSLIIPFVLIGLGHGEIRNCVIESAGVAEVSADHRSVSRLGMGWGECPSTPFSIVCQNTRIENFDERFDLNVT